MNYIDGAFQVNAVTDAYIDHTKLEAGGLTFSVTTGLGYALNDRLSVSGDVFYTPLMVQRSPNVPRGLDGLFNARALLTYRVHLWKASDGCSRSWPPVSASPRP